MASYFDTSSHVHQPCPLQAMWFLLMHTNAGRDCQQIQLHHLHDLRGSDVDAMSTHACGGGGGKEVVCALLEL